MEQLKNEVALNQADEPAKLRLSPEKILISSKADQGPLLEKLWLMKTTRNQANCEFFLAKWILMGIIIILSFQPSKRGCRLMNCKRIPRFPKWRPPCIFRHRNSTIFLLFCSCKNCLSQILNKKHHFHSSTEPVHTPQFNGIFQERWGLYKLSEITSRSGLNKEWILGGWWARPNYSSERPIPFSDCSQNQKSGHPSWFWEESPLPFDSSRLSDAPRRTSSAPSTIWKAFDRSSWSWRELCFACILCKSLLRLSLRTRPCSSVSSREVLGNWVSQMETPKGRLWSCQRTFPGFRTWRMRLHCRTGQRNSHWRLNRLSLWNNPTILGSVAWFNQK